MRLTASSDQAIAGAIVAHIQAIRLKKNLSLEDVAKNAGMSRQTLHALLNQGKGTLINLVAVLRAIGELERLVSLLEEVLPSPLQVIRMEGKKRKRASGRRNVPKKPTTTGSNPKKNNDW
jgi:putative transcriptional regulator